MTYLFKTETTMKPYNNKKWWIDSKIIRDIGIEADTVEKALTIYQERVRDKYYIEISKSALKNKNAMHRDTKNGAIQCGFVITAKADFQDGDNYKWSAQYIELWVEILIIKNAFEGGAAHENIS